MKSGSPPAPIIELSPEEVKKISAGEVVDRPLSIVKELIENSLDAQADSITVELRDGGKQLIRVTDNGAGIAYEELPIAFKPHSTSKIRSLDDLFKLTTLGFRGEALASIAAVSRVKLTSIQQESDLGGRIEIEGSEVIIHNRESIHQGTEIEVSDLFYNVPARRKFLKSKQAETSQISTLISSYALANPDVRFELISQGRKLIKTDGEGGLRSVLSGLIGEEAADSLVEIDFEHPPNRAFGMITSPNHHRLNRQRQWYFINSRPVINKLLYKAVDDAVRDFMSQGKYPLGAFFLELMPEEIDVNVHPMKHEVNFADPRSVYALLNTAIRRSLGSASAEHRRSMTMGLSSVVSTVSSHVEKPIPDSSLFDTHKEGLTDPPPRHRSIPVFSASLPEEKVETEPGSSDNSIHFPTANERKQYARQGKSALDSRLSDPDSLVSFASTEEPVESHSQINQHEVLADRPCPGLIAQVSNSYLVAVGDDEIYLIDQHAAHERMLFDDLYERYLPDPNSSAPRQRLLFPLVVQLTVGEAELAEVFIPALDRLGFDCEVGAGPSLLVKALPLALSGLITAELVHGVLSDLKDHPRSSVLDNQSKELAASLACRAAIKAGDHLAPDERYTLVRSLLGRINNLSCPHGRPLVIRLGVNELERLFLR